MVSPYSNRTPSPLFILFMDFLLIIVCNLGIPMIPLRDPCFCVEPFEYIFRKYTISILLTPINAIYYSESGFHILLNGYNIVPILTLLVVMVVVEGFGKGSEIVPIATAHTGIKIDAKTDNMTDAKTDNMADAKTDTKMDTKTGVDFTIYKKTIYFILTMSIFGFVFFERYNEVKTHHWSQFLSAGIVVFIIPLIVFLGKFGIVFILKNSARRQNKARIIVENGLNKDISGLQDENGDEIILSICPNCEAEYHSNPKICFKCNYKLR